MVRVSNRQPAAVLCVFLGALVLLLLMVARSASADKPAALSPQTLSMPSGPTSLKRRRAVRQRPDHPVHGHGQAHVVALVSPNT